MKLFRFKLSTIFILFLFMITLLSNVSYASVMGEDCANAAAFDAGSVVKCELETKMNIETMALIDSDQFIMDTAKEHTLNINVDPDEVKGFNAKVVYIALLLLFFVCIYTGYIFIYSAADPKKRIAAKKQFIGLIILAAVIPTSFFFANLIFGLSNEISTTLEVVVPGEVEDISSFFDLDPWADIGDLGGGGVEETSQTYSSLLMPSRFIMISGFLYNISMAARNIIIYTFFVLCPLFVFLFLFEPTRAIGRFLLVLMGVEFFIPIVFVTVFRVSSHLISDISLATEVATAQSHMLVISAALLLCAALHYALAIVIIMRRSSI